MSSSDDFDCRNCQDNGCIDCTDPGTPIPDAVLADIRANYTTWTMQQLGQEEIKRLFHVVRLLLAENDHLRDLAAASGCPVHPAGCEADDHIEPPTVDGLVV